MVETVSDKAMAFLVEFEALCQKYQIQPRVSPYGVLELYDREEGDCPMTDCGIENQLGNPFRLQWPGWE